MVTWIPMAWQRHSTRNSWRAKNKRRSKKKCDDNVKDWTRHWKKMFQWWPIRSNPINAYAYAKDINGRCSWVFIVLIMRRRYNCFDHDAHMYSLMLYLNYHIYHIHRSLGLCLFGHLQIFPVSVVLFLQFGCPWILCNAQFSRSANSRKISDYPFQKDLVTPGYN